MRQLAGPKGTWVAAAAAVAAAVAVWATLSADFLAYPGWLAAQKADVILGPVLVGLYWIRRRPASRFGLLLVSMGLVAGIPYILQSSSAPLPFAIGVFWESVIYTATLALILGFPGGRFGRAERVILVVAGVAVLGIYLALVLLGPAIGTLSSIATCRSACPPNGLRIVSEPELAADVIRVGRSVILLVGLATIVLLVRRLVTGTPLALAFLVSQLAFQAARLLELDADTFYRVAQWTIVATRSLVWYGFLFALIAAELYAARVLRGVVTASLKRPGPAELEAMLRGPLGDTSLRLGFRSGDEWVDGEGAVLEPPARGRMLTEI